MSRYLQRALITFNTDKPQWYGWKTHDDDGNKIPNEDRMQYKYVKLNQVNQMLMLKYKN